ncbi:hypothetical protein [Piscinibacter sp.]|jgi:hypothetical protein|uniref:hypothetical protein n=1 Tax=Piscinibacter sp. TaxID=1903157 RepID=UPI00355AA629
MHKHSAVWQFIRDFVRALGVEARRFAVWSNAIEIVEQNENCLVLRANNRRIVADKLARTIKAGNRVVASFDSIRSIDIKYFCTGDGPEWWTVSLCLGRHRRVPIGKTSDDAQASIAAARLSTITGKKVVALT